MKHLTHIIASAAMLFSTVGAAAQNTTSIASVIPDATAVTEALDSIYIMPDSAFFVERTLEELHAHLDTVNISATDPSWHDRVLPRYSFRPAVYEDFLLADSTSVETPLFSDNPATRWVEEEAALAQRMNRMNRYLFFKHPDVVAYNINLLPEAPKRFTATVDPTKHTIEITENITNTEVTSTLHAEELKKRHWIRTFTASLQFSQAYVSPNWYQGGNNSLTVLGNLYYNVKLNPKYHPNLLFETTAQYKLGLNNAPNDSIHDYTISDDLLQINTMLGIKAVSKWYYSFNAQLKTQLFNYYPVNSRNLRSAFLSPGEFTAGIGMTYNTTNQKKTFNFDASISPLSYSLKTCVNSDIDPTIYSLEPHHKTKSKFGSSATLNWTWKLAYNITYRSRFFTFTDYESFQADWENTVSFEINRFLSTQIFVHARFDSKTPPTENPDSKWKKLQLMEILSIGFAYKFSML